MRRDCVEHPARRGSRIGRRNGGARQRVRPRFLPAAEAMEARQLLSVGDPVAPTIAAVPPAVILAGEGDVVPSTSPQPHIKGQAGLGIVNAEVGYIYFKKASPDLAKGTVTIDWGDGTAPTAGRFEPFYGPGEIFHAAPEDQDSEVVLIVNGDHTYARPGDYTLTVTYTGADGTPSITSAATIAPAGTPLPPRGHEVRGVAGRGTGGTIATQSQLDPNPSLDDFTTSIDWGDGTKPTVGRLEIFYGSYGIFGDPPDTQGPAALIVEGSHTYARPGTYTIRVTITRADAVTSEATTTATIAHGDTTGDPADGGDGGAPGGGDGDITATPVALGSNSHRGSDSGSPVVTKAGGGGTTPAPASPPPGLFGPGTPSRLPMTPLVRFLLKNGETVRQARPKFYAHFLRVTVPRLARRQARIDLRASHALHGGASRSASGSPSGADASGHRTGLLGQARVTHFALNIPRARGFHAARPN